VNFELPDFGDCVFCNIVAGDAEASWEQRPSSNTRVVCFHNRLKWARVMLLVIPTEHMTQSELWNSDALIDAARLTVEMGDRHCGDEGYRAISNFGLQAHQSQTHGHIHVVSGTSRQLQSAIPRGSDEIYGSFSVAEYEVEETPFAARHQPVGESSQRELWLSDQILEASRQAFVTAERRSPNGFRLMSSFEPGTSETSPGNNPAGLFLLGGGQLGLYV